MLSVTGKTIRVVALVLGLALLLAGTLWGQDNAFPFGPFRMYSTRDQLNQPVRATRIDGVTTTGRRLVISGTETGLRPAEVEGQLSRFQQHPTLLATLAHAYEQRHHGRRLARVEMVRRDFTVVHGRASGRYYDTVLATWREG